MTLVLHQYRYDQKQFWREPASVFFTVVLPLIFFTLFAAIFGNDTTVVDGQEIDTATYYVPAIIALSLINATFVNLTIWLTIQRERGQLKRIRATPVPAWVVIAGRTLTAVAIAAVMVVIVCLFGAVLYGVKLPTSTLPGVVPSENAAPPIANVIVLPLEFISGIFVPA